MEAAAVTVTVAPTAQLDAHGQVPALPEPRLGEEEPPEGLDPEPEPDEPDPGEYALGVEPAAWAETAVLETG